MKIHHFIFFNISFMLMLMSPMLSAQDEVMIDDPDKLAINEDYIKQSIIDSTVLKPKDKKLKVGLEAGTSYSVSPGNFHGPAYYLAPNLNYQVSPRFTLTGGIGLGYGTIYPVGNMEQGMLPMTRMFLYARGSYMLSERLRISGTVYHIEEDVPYRRHNQNQISSYNYQGMTMGFDYKITPSLSVGIHVGVQNGVSPLYYDPFNKGYYDRLYPGYSW